MADDLQTIREAYLDNADYDIDNSVSEAKAFRAACRRLIAMLPSSASRGGSGGSQQFAYRIDEIQKQFHEVQAWLALNDTDTYGVVHPDFSHSRGDV